MLNFLVRLSINAFIFTSLLIGFIALYEDAMASEEIKIIGCINSVTLETKLPKNWNCFYWKGWQNIMLPTVSQIEIWREVFPNDEMIINRLPIVNFESGFDEYAGNKYAKGYVQTLRSYSIPPDVESQLEWMRDRQDSQKEWSCSHYSDSGEERMMRCLYARHYGATSWYDWYPNKLIVARNFYINYFKTNSL